jgi:hypothetical protein
MSKPVNKWAKILPRDFCNFTYSKNFQPKFIAELGYKLPGHDDAKALAEFSIEEYQSILVNCLIRSNIPMGRRILSIGDLPDKLFKHLSEDYEVFVLSDSRLLAETFSRHNLRCSNSETIITESMVESFDCVFTVSGLDDFSYDFATKNIVRIFYNLSNILKSSSMCLFTFESFEHKGVETVNALAYYYFQYVDLGLKPMISYTPMKEIAQDKQTLRFAFGEQVSTDFKESSRQVYQCFSYNVYLIKSIAKLPTSTITKPRDYLKKNPAYIFHHLIKCGGSSLVKELDKWFSLQFDHILVGDDVNRLSKFKYNTEVLTSDICITSHFHYNGFLVGQRYPELLKAESGIRLFTFVREPLGFQISLYYFERQKGGIPNLGLIDFLETMPNFLSTLFPCTEENYREVIDRYFFIGILERMQESVDKLAKLSGKRTFIVKKENISQKDSQRDLIDDKVIDRFKKLNKLDYMIYEYCVNKFDKIHED